MKRTIPLVFSLLLSACAAPMASHHGVAPVTVGIVAINDFHGSLEPPHQSVFVPDGKGGMVGVPAGGAAWLASAIDSVRSKYPNHLTVSAGDLISASQIASSIFLDEPAIGVANRIGLEFNAVGNHEFDQGREELLRKQTGGCAQHTARKPCQIEPFTGAQFSFLAASTLTESGATLFPATAIKTFGKGRGKVTIGLIGLTLRDTSNLVSPDRIAGLRFVDEADTINALVPTLKQQGADAVVLLIHQGGRTAEGSDPSGCADFIGDIKPVLDRLDVRVDVVISGHTHWPYVCDYGAINPAKPFLLTSAGVYGELVTDMKLEIDPVTHRVVGKSAHNIVVQSAPYLATRGPVANSDVVPRFAPRADVSAYVARYVDAAKGYSQRVVGSLAGPAGKNSNKQIDQGGALGNLLADAQLAATAGAGAQIAFMNPFGIRANIVPDPDGKVTFGMIYQVQPFNNQLMTQTVTGAELKAILEQAVRPNAPVEFLTPSQGFSYVVDPKGADGRRVISMTFNGKPVDPAAQYRVTTSSFLGNGGDGFSLFLSARDKVLGVTDIEALEGWLKAIPPRPVPGESRVTQTGN